jgi:Cft2 family RNA processing exonuclease
VSCGNMTLLLFPGATTYLHDCNITDENEGDMRKYLKKAMGTRSVIDVFICSHRDCDHMRGLRTVHGSYLIGQIRDAGVEGTSCDCSEYKDYMKLRREIGSTGDRIILDAGRPLGAPEGATGLLPTSLDRSRPVTTLISHPHQDHWDAGPVNPQNPGTIYAGTDDGVAQSTDGGENSA